MLTRRELLRVLGSSAAAGALWSLGCGGGRAAARRPTPADVRVALRAAVAQVRARWPEASGWIAIRERTTAIAGTDARGTARHTTATVVLRARGDGPAIERVIGNASPDALARLAGELAALGPGGGELAGGAAEDHAAVVERDPAQTAAARWLAELDETLRRAEALGSSRIVWRAAHAVVDDERTWFVGDGRDVAQRAVRVRSGVTMMAWSGTRPMIGETVVGRAAGLEALALGEPAIAAAANGALELLTPGDPPSGRHAVVLAPSVTAALLAAGIGGVLTTARWARPDHPARGRVGAPVAAAGVTIVDDPAAGGLAGYRVDDEGTPATRAVLVDDGRLAGLLADAAGAARAGVARTGHGRRGHGDGAVAARPSDLTLLPGAATDDDLLAAIEDGVLVEDADGAAVDLATWQVVIRARRARRVARGGLTGHAWGDVEVRGDLPGLLGGVVAVGAATTTAVAPGDGPPATATAPAIATTAELRPRRPA